VIFDRTETSGGYPGLGAGSAAAQGEQEGIADGQSGSTAAGAVFAPAIWRPKVAAHRGIGDKFTTNSVPGSGPLVVPIATSPGRSGFGPQLFSSYDSGADNGSFGFGWSISQTACWMTAGGKRWRR
jgi:hypothetical protein